MKYYFKVIIAITIIIIIGFFSYLLYKHFILNRYVITNSKVGSIKTITIPSNKIQLARALKGLNSSFSLWMYIDNWNYKFNQEKHILEKGGLQLKLGDKLNNLILTIPILNSTTPEKIIFKDFPLQKWNHIVINIDNRNIDLWVNGKLYRSKYLNNLPKIMDNKDTIISKNNGFSGFYSKIYFYKHILYKRKIKLLYEEGPINYNPIVLIQNYINKIYEKNKKALSKFNYKVCIPKKK